MSGFSSQITNYIDVNIKIVYGLCNKRTESDIQRRFASDSYMIFVSLSILCATKSVQSHRTFRIFLGTLVSKICIVHFLINLEVILILLKKH